MWKVGFTMEEVNILPSRLEEWTYETVENIVKTRDFEPGLFDYKGVLNPPGGSNSVRDSIRRTVCSMANTRGGGFILFGVKDREHMQEVDTLEDRIHGISINGELLKTFGDKISVIQPDVHFESIPQAIPVPHRPKNGIFVVRIPQSQRRPHMVFFDGGGGGIYYKRGEHGAAVPMTHAEVQEQMIYTEDRMKTVTLLRLELMQYTEIALDARARLSWVPDRFDVSAFKVLLAEVCSLISTNLLREMLNIPRQATIINKYLEEIHGKDPKTMLNTYNEIQTAIRNFYMLCNKCEKTLEKEFGPVGIG